MKTHRPILLMPVLLIAALLAGACAAPPTPPQVEPTQTATSAPVQAEPTQADLPTPEGSAIDLEGLRFILDPAVALRASGQVVPEHPRSPGSPYWEVYPQHALVTLDGYAVQGSNQTPRLAVYPTEDYRRLSPEASDILEQLAGVLAAGEAGTATIPALPLINAGQGLHSNVRFMDFQNGSGVRFLAIYSQAPDPITNRELVYVFQGLTENGQKAVSVFLPVNHPELAPDPNAVSEETLNVMYQDYGAYISNVTAMLEGEPAGSFTPSLEALDALIASLLVE